jgi:hypothetical protein
MSVGHTFWTRRVIRPVTSRDTVRIGGAPITMSESAPAADTYSAYVLVPSKSKTSSPSFDSGSHGDRADQQPPKYLPAGGGAGLQGLAQVLQQLLRLFEPG